VAFRDRFTDATFESSASVMQDFVDLTLANEIEIAAPGSGEPVPTWLHGLVDHMQAWASAPARRGVEALLGPCEGVRSRGREER
jgi:hypothetical protein